MFLWSLTSSPSSPHKVSSVSLTLAAPSSAKPSRPANPRPSSSTSAPSAALYQDFIQAIDELRSPVSDVDTLKSSLSESNAKLQAVGLPLLKSLDAFVEAQNVCRNVNLALQSVRSYVRLMELCSQSNYHLSRGNFYMAQGDEGLQRLAG
ncbi:hypothetical protein ACLB2K_022269 [Fragaria x ananassa]